MNKKLFTLALAVVFSAGCAMATNITGVTGSNGVYNINPEHFNGNVGYRKYDNFDLSSGDVANLNFVRPNGNNPSVFVNLVGRNGINIDGIVNTTRNGSFYNGHAVFITPGSFVLGSNGVLNVGSLAVGTPTQAKYDDMVNGYGTAGFNYGEKIGNNVLKLAQNTDGTGGAADITFHSGGKVFARGDIRMAGKNVNFYSDNVNGLNSTQDQVFTNQADAVTLFRALVNVGTGAIKNPEAFKAPNEAGKILIRSENKLSVVNNTVNPGDIYLTNKGSDGMSISDNITSGKDLRLFNDGGDLGIYSAQAGGYTHLNADRLVINNKGNNIDTVNNGEMAINANSIYINNRGTGYLRLNADVNANKVLAIRNFTGDGVNIDYGAKLTNTDGVTTIMNQKGNLDVKGDIDTSGKLNIVNNGAKLNIDQYSNVKNNGTTTITNAGDVGLEVSGKIDNTGDLKILNDKGLLTVGNKAKITNQNGDLRIVSRKQSDGLNINAGADSSAEVQNTNGNIYIADNGSGNSPTYYYSTNFSISGKVKHEGSGNTVIYNRSSRDENLMSVTGSIESNGNISITNDCGLGDMALNGSITGKNINIQDHAVNPGVQNTGTTINGTITNTGRVNIVKTNDGELNVGAKIHNNSGALGSNGGLYISNKSYGYGVNITDRFNVDGKGDVQIRNEGYYGNLNYAGKIDTTGHRVTLVNNSGDMNISGSIKTTGAPIVILNRGNQMTVTETANLDSGTRGTLFDKGAAEPVISPNATIHNMNGGGNLYGQHWD